MRYYKISDNTIRRLPRYLRTLEKLREQGETRISSYGLGQLLGIGSSRIRQDLSHFGTFGVQGYGYSVTALRDAISKVLGMDHKFSAVLVGCGNIGKALLCNFDFAACGINLMTGFDVSSEVVGTTHNGIEIKSMEELDCYLTENHIDLAVLCVPKEVAVSTADILTRNGIKAIWNFTNIDIIEPGSQILVENVHFSDSLLALSYYLSETIMD